MRPKPPDFTPEYLRTVLDYEPSTGVFRRKVSNTNNVKIGDEAGWVDHLGYIIIGIDGRNYRAHNLAWYYVKGEWPTNELDHKNNISGDNRVENLRLATRSQQEANRPKFKNNTSGYKGVSWYKRDRKWRAYIVKDDKQLHLGYFNTLEKAKKVFRDKAIELYGEFSNFN